MPTPAIPSTPTPTHSSRARKRPSEPRRASSTRKRARLDTVDEEEPPSSVGVDLCEWVTAAAIATYTTQVGGYSVLEVGCGDARHLSKWARLGMRKYVGVDAVAAPLAAGRSRAAALASCAVAPRDVPLVPSSEPWARDDAHSRAVPPEVHFVQADAAAADLPARLRGDRFEAVFVPDLSRAFASDAALARTFANLAGVLHADGVGVALLPDAEELMARAPHLVSSVARTGGALHGELAGSFFACPRVMAGAAARAHLYVKRDLNVATFARACGVAGASAYPSSRVQAAAWRELYRPLWQAYGFDAAPPTAADWAHAALFKVVTFVHARRAPYLPLYTAQLAALPYVTPPLEACTCHRDATKNTTMSAATSNMTTAGGSVRALLPGADAPSVELGVARHRAYVVASGSAVPDGAATFKTLRRALH